MLWSFFLILVLFISSCATTKKKDIHLRPFKTDGCTLYPDGNWLHCCIAHDMDYWIGGSYAEKEKADDELGACVAETKGNAKLMIEGVHFGGGPNDVLPWAWGYGWTKNPGYMALSEKQLYEVEVQLETVIPGVRELESRLSTKQLSYVLKRFQRLKVETSRKF